MFHYLLTLTIVATSFLGPNPCCCTLAVARPVEGEAKQDQCCCCCQPVIPETSPNSVAEPRMAAPTPRCRCDHSLSAEPLIVAKFELKERSHSTVEWLPRPLPTMLECFTPELTISLRIESHNLSGRALLRALHVMRC